MDEYAISMIIHVVVYTVIVVGCNLMGGDL